MDKYVDRILDEFGIKKNSLEERGLHRYKEPLNLEIIQTDNNGKNHYLNPEAAHAWREMKSSALIDGIELIIVSAFRSIDYQAEIIRKKLDKGLSIEEILKVSAAPGYSEHHTGRAIDITSPNSPILEEYFEFTPAFEWLNKNADKFNYYLSFGKNNSQGYLYEPWHWCYVKK